MRKLTQISIRKYIILGIMFIMLLIMVLMLMFVNRLAEGAIEEDVQVYLINAMVDGTRNISFVDGRFEKGEKYEENVDDDEYLLVLNKEGEVLYGKYPENLNPYVKIDRGHLVTVKGRQKTYYMYDRVNRRLSKEYGDKIFTRIVVNKQNVRSEYLKIKYEGYLMAMIMLLLVLLYSLYMSRKITEPLEKMCHVAENIGKDDNLSARVDYDGRFQEIQVLSEANDRMLDRLEHMFQVQHQFNSDVAHELRTPVSVILAQCEYINEKKPDLVDYQEFAEVVERQTKKTSEIIKKLLNLSRMEQGRIKVQLEMVRLPDLLQVICEDEQEKMSENLNIHFACEDVEAYVDIQLVRILVQNLLDNAIKYSDKNTKIEIGTKRTENEIRLWVMDHGCGISKEEQKNIFQPFYRSEKVRNSKGIGLGLSLVQRIAELHGGKIQGESELGKGSTFTLILPVKKEV